VTATKQPVLVSIRDAADMLGLTTWTIYFLCECGELASGLVGRRRMVSVESVGAYADRVVAPSA
jgi:hypothetical protein